MILQRNISLICNDLGASKGTRRIPEQTIELDYILGWFLSCLAKADFGKKSAFKGGTALRRCYFEDYRFSEDLDFTLLDDSDFDSIEAAFRKIGEDTYKESGIKVDFDRRDHHQHLNGFTFYMKYVGPLNKAREFKVDITRQERIVHNLELVPILHTYAHYDFPEDRSLKAYSIQEIATEKIVALTDPARNQPRDLFDIWKLASENHVDVAHLVTAVAQKIDFRSREANDLGSNFDKKEKKLHSTWETRLNPQMNSTPPFDQVYREVKRIFRQSQIFEAVIPELRRIRSQGS